VPRMTRPRLLRIAIVAAVVVLLLFFALRPQSRLVDSAVVARGEVVASVEAEGRTRVRDRYLITAPIAAQARRLALEPGDPVEAGQVLVTLDPLPAGALDPRSLTEARSRANAAESRRRAAAEALQAADVAATQAAADADRLRQLVARGLVASEQAERAETLRLQAARAAAAARFELATATHERDAARAAIELGSGTRSDAIALELRAPIEGVVLRRHYESAMPVQPGAPLLEIGDPAAMDVEVDVLSADAVRLRPGMSVELLRWGQPQPLAARVQRIEPGGFTKVSALGVEEQRVWVIMAIDSPREAWEGLGDAYRVDARFVLDQRTEALRLPTSALFRTGEQWAVFRLDNGRARLTPVQVGLRGGLVAEVLAGLAEGDRVIVHPDRELEDDARVAAR
jgi:HlyD family secretion protein